MSTMVIEGGQEFVFDVLKMRSVGPQSVLSVESQQELQLNRTHFCYN